MPTGSPSDPFARFVADHSLNDGTPMAPLREAVSGPAGDPFASRVSDDATAAPEEAPPATFRDPLAARIDPDARAIDIPETTGGPSLPAPRFSRRVSTVSIPIRAGRTDALAERLTRVRESRRERDAGEPNYALGEIVRRAPRPEGPRPTAHRSPHKNLLTHLLG